jgi:beta-phosphoglucomutase-like phosphatase (HAD superfamily)
MYKIKYSKFAPYEAVLCDLDGTLTQSIDPRIKLRNLVNMGRFLAGEKIFMPGSLRFIDRCRTDGKQLGLVTNAGDGLVSLYKVPSVLHDKPLASLFDTVVSGSGKRKKPHPDLYLRAMDDLERTPQECVVFEDSAEGANAALSAGIENLVIVGGEAEKRTKLRRFEKYGNIHYIDSFHEINFHR